MNRNLYGAIAVTGIAAHSLGEAIIRHLHGSECTNPLIGIDCVVNRRLALSRLHQVTLDLNPLHYNGLADEFNSTFSEVLSPKVPRDGIGCLIECAGVYGAGRLAGMDLQAHADILGLNVLGTTEVLYAALKINEGLGRDNGQSFLHVLVGSFQGLFARKERSLYAASKAYGIDLCTSLVEGGEIAKCIYLAPGLIDTPMLHRNHWLSKAGGPLAIFDEALNGSPDRYDSMFRNCDTGIWNAIMSDLTGGQREAISSALCRYRTIRSEALRAGILSPDVCAALIVQIVADSESQSGLFSIEPVNGQEPQVTFTRFTALDRRKLLQRSGCTQLR